MRGNAGSAAAPAATYKKLRRGSFTAFPATSLRDYWILVQRLALDGAAAQRSALFARPIGAGVQAREVVPHDEVARPPDVLVDDGRILGDREQPLQQRFAFIAVHAFDPHRILAGDVERLAAGAGIGDEDRLGAVMGALERQRDVDAAADTVLLALHDHDAA